MGLIPCNISMNLYEINGINQTQIRNQNIYSLHILDTLYILQFYSSRLVLNTRSNKLQFDCLVSYSKHIMYHDLLWIISRLIVFLVNTHMHTQTHIQWFLLGSFGLILGTCVLKANAFSRPPYTVLHISESLSKFVPYHWTECMIHSIPLMLFK